MSARQARLADVCTVVGGGTPARSVAEYYGGSIPWVTPKDMKTWEIEGSQVTITDAGLENSATRLVPPNSVLVVVRSGVLKHTVPVAINRVPVAINQDMKALLCSDSAYPDYVARFVKARSPVILQWVRATTADNFPIDKLKRLEIPLPLLPEQRRVAEILDRADALRAKRRAVLAQLDTLTRSIFLDMFGDPATNPKGWPQVTITDLCEVKGGKRLPKGEEYSATPTPFRYIRVVDLKDGRVDESGLVHLKPEIQAQIARYVVNPGDVIISIAGSIGLVAPVPASLGGVNLTENAAKLVPRRKGEYEPEYLSTFLQTRHAQSQIGSHIGQVTIGKLALFRIEKIKVPMPPRDLQRDFVQRIAAAEAHSAVQHRALVQLTALFASLQHRAFRGEL
jgi:type I restriction enzyme S subunit